VSLIVQLRSSKTKKLALLFIPFLSFTCTTIAQLSFPRFTETYFREILSGSLSVGTGENIAEKDDKSSRKRFESVEVIFAHYSYGSKTEGLLPLVPEEVQ